MSKNFKSPYSSRDSFFFLDKILDLKLLIKKSFQIVSLWGLFVTRNILAWASTSHGYRNKNQSIIVGHNTLYITASIIKHLH